MAQRFEFFLKVLIFFFKDYHILNCPILETHLYIHFSPSPTSLRRYEVKKKADG